MAKIGFAYLGFQGYSKKHCKHVLRNYRGLDVKVLAFLWDSFGTDKTNLKRWYRVCDEFSITQVYLSNEVDRRKNRTDKNNLLYTMNPGDFNRALENKDKPTMKAVRKRAKEIYDFHQQYGKGKLKIALGLEHQMTQKALNNMAAAVRKVAPGVELISNPVHVGPYTGKGDCDILEFHRVTHKSEPKGKYVAATDGYDICPDQCGRNISGDTINTSNLVKVIKKFRKSEYFLLWHSSFNSLSADSQFVPPPSERESAISKSCIRHLRKNVIDVVLKEYPSKTYPKVKRCKDLKDPFKTRNFVWKESDHGGTVVVFPQEYDKQFSKVELFEPEGKKHNLYYTGFANENRQHWRHKNDPKIFPKNCDIRATYRKGIWGLFKRVTICWIIKDPSVRNAG